jgi:hypothetical protein
MFKISPLKLGDMMAEIRNTYPKIWERIITSENTTPSTDLMKTIAKLDPDFIDKNYNGVQLMQIIYEKKDFYLELISKPEIIPKVVEPPDADQCAPTLEAEALERLRMIVDINFKTIRGLVLLESDLALFDPDTDTSVWLESMKTEWEARLHSEWLDEFMEALQLWILSKP